jgi:serine/threonine-protein kinase HipA
MKRAKIYMRNIQAGQLTEDENGYSFSYNKEYLNTDDAEAISLTLPLQEETYRNNVLFPFFDGLIPEGWLLEIAERNWKIDRRDRMSLLLVCCKDCIGAVSVIPIENEIV